MQQKTEWHELDTLLNGCLPTLSNLLEYLQLGGKCRKCGHIFPLNRYDLAAKYGRDQYITALRHKLRCQACGHRGSNTFVVSKMPR